MPIVRVAILADSRLTEMALPAELPLREILPAVQRLVIPVAFLATGLAVGYRVATGALAGLLAVGVIAALTALAGLLVRGRPAGTGMALSITALAPISAALALAVPGKFGAAQLMLVAAG